MVLGCGVLLGVVSCLSWVDAGLVCLSFCFGFVCGLWVFVWLLTLVVGICVCFDGYCRLRFGFSVIVLILAPITG